MPTSQVVVGIISTDVCKVPGTSRCSIKAIIIVFFCFFLLKNNMDFFPGSRSQPSWLPLSLHVMPSSQTSTHSTQLSSEFVTWGTLWSRRKARKETSEVECQEPVVPRRWGVHGISFPLFLVKSIYQSVFSDEPS